MATSYSCENLEGTIAFFPQELGLCCMPHHGDRGIVIVCSYKGGAVPVDRLLAKRREVKLALNAEGFYKCQGCQCLCYREWEESPFLFNQLVLAHFTRCNADCIYCYRQSMPAEARNLPSYEIYPVIEDLRARNLLAPSPGVYWGGGEPSILPDFGPTGLLLAECGSTQMINTNGIVLNQVLYELLAARQASITCSIDAGTRDTYRTIKTVDAFDRVVANLEVYSKGGQHDVRLKVIFREENANKENVSGILSVLNRTGIRVLVLDVDQRDGKGTWEPKRRFEILGAMADLRRQAHTQKIQVQTGGSGALTFSGLDLAQLLDTYDAERPTPAHDCHV